MRRQRGFRLRESGAFAFASLIVVGCSSAGSVIPIYEGDASLKVDSAAPRRDGGGDAAESCPAHETSCNGACVDLARSLSDCGSCGVGCQAGEVCSLGSCSLVCGGGTTKCGVSCADTKNDSTNCGGCGALCGGGKLCANGVCTVTCGAGLAVCPSDAGPGCANLKNDPANCGLCGKSCAAGQACLSEVCRTVTP